MNEKRKEVNREVNKVKPSFVNYQYPFNFQAYIARNFSIS